MSITLFKTWWKVYKAWIVLTWELKKTKKNCWIDYKKERTHYNEPAKITPKIISETYDGIKSFLQNYFEPCDFEDRTDWTWIIVTSSDYAEYTLHSRCYIKVYDKDWEFRYDSRDYMWYSQRKRICLAFFDNIEPRDDYKKFIIDIDDSWYFKKT